MDMDKFLNLIEADYAECGVMGALSCDISEADLASGYQHCLAKALPHIEEEMIAAGEVDA